MEKDPTYDLHHKVAIVTGGSRGIGKTCALALAREGVSVNLVARTAADLENTAREIREAGGNAHFFCGDISEASFIKEMVHTVLAKQESIDLLINNAGIAPPFGPTWETDPEAWSTCFKTNLYGPYLCCREIIPHMLQQKKSYIINVSSGAGNKAIPYMAAYVTSKTALTRFTETLALELQETGIHVFAINPGPVRTQMTLHGLQSEKGKQYLTSLQKIFAEGKDVPAEHTADLLLFLLSGKADALSGKFLSTDHDYRNFLHHLDSIKKEELLALRLNQ